MSWQLPCYSVSWRLGCSSGGDSGDETAAKAVPEPSTAQPATTDPELAQPSVASTEVVPSIESTPEPYDPNRIMYAFFPGIVIPPETIRDTLQAVLDQQDVSQVPVLVEAARFMPGRVYDQYATTLEQLTGETFGGLGFRGVGWGAWMEWLGNHLDEYQPPEKYVDWKINYMAQISPRFPLFLGPAREISRIDPTEIVWGGVRPDGIPDLQNPQTLSAEDADYMLAGDRVVGVSINGEIRGLSSTYT